MQSCPEPVHESGDLLFRLDAETYEAAQASAEVALDSAPTTIRIASGHSVWGGALAQNATGLGVLGGMTAATFIGIFMVPAFYVIVRKLTHRSA